MASLAVFRVLFGAVLFWEVWRFFDNGWIRTYYIAREVHFKYLGFGWVQAWPGDWMYVHFAVVGLLALGVAVGYRYRLCSALLFVGFAYWFLLDKTRYLNHLYLTLILCFLMALVPAHRGASLDALRRPGLRSETVPAWSLWLLRGQIAVVYLHAALAKLNGDWLRGAPMGAWLRARDELPLIGPLLGQSIAVPVFAWGGFLFDLTVVPLLLWRRTRLLAVLLSVFFHVTNKWLFDIGIFPVLMLGATTLLLSPDWPRRLCLLFPPLGPSRSPSHRGAAAGVGAPRVGRWLTGFLALWFVVQLAVPLRHWLYPGNVNWTEEGHCFSWRMKLRDKDTVSTRFLATDPATGREWVVDQGSTLSTRQREKVGQWPDLAHQFALITAQRMLEEGLGEVEIRVEALVSLNGREPQLLIDPEVDLVAQPRSLAPAEWIMPLDRPLPGE
ncbi:HTTM domain-containing protein [Engelhardtia mirabilis]|uniref:HTTM domain-containing protein n=1 Tax=Engelhardtia mirabilis TaxID=2528011 RepID=UPI003AF3C100